MLAAEVLAHAATLLRQEPSLRVGQAMMICLHDLDRDRYIALTGTPDDPFHDDRHIPAFLAQLQEAP